MHGLAESGTEMNRLAGRCCGLGVTFKSRTCVDMAPAIPMAISIIWIDLPSRNDFRQGWGGYP